MIRRPKNEIIRLQKENPDELIDSFYQNLEFGTGGLRGIMGVGTNRINKYTIGMATQGYSNYLLKSFPNHAGESGSSRMTAEITAVFLLKQLQRFLLQTESRFFSSSHCVQLRN